MSEADEMGTAGIIIWVIVFDSLAAALVWLVIGVIVPTNAPQLFLLLHERFPVVIVGYDVLLAPAFLLLAGLIIWVSAIGILTKMIGPAAPIVRKIRKGVDGATIFVPIFGLMIAPVAAKCMELYVSSQGYHKCQELTNFGVHVYQPGYVRDARFCVPEDRLNETLRRHGYRPLAGARFD